MMVPPKGKQKVKKAVKKEKIDDIINAVSKKEDVLVPVKGKKEEPKKHVTDFLYSDEKLQTPEGIGRALRDLHRSLLSSKILNMADTFATPWKYWSLRFVGGFFFAVGIGVAIFVALFIAVVVNKVAFIGGIFDKFVYFLKAMI